MTKSTKTTRGAKANKKAKVAKAAKVTKAARNAQSTEANSLTKWTILFKILFIMTGVLFFIVTIVGMFYTNFNAGVVMLICAESGLILYGIFFERLIRIKWLTFTILAGCVCALVMMISIWAYGIQDNATYREDALIVLGAGIRGERVSMTLARRLEKAVEYARKNQEAAIIVSGAQGFQEDITEALAMERYLTRRGIPGERIIKEEDATSSYENLLYSKAILDKLYIEPYEVVIITNEFHIYRASKLAEKLELNATHIHSNTVWYEVPRNYLRECLAIFKFWLLG